MRATSSVSRSRRVSVLAVVTPGRVHDTTGDVGRVVGHQPGDHPRHVRRIEIQIRWRSRGPEHGLVHAGEGTGRHRVHGDSVLATGFGERQRQRPDRGLRRAVPDGRRRSAAGRARPPTRCSRCGRHRGPRGEATRLGRCRPVPTKLTARSCSSSSSVISVMTAPPATARVVDHDVDPTEGVERGLHRDAATLEGRHVADVGNRAPAGGGDLVDDRVGHRQDPGRRRRARRRRRTPRPPHRAPRAGARAPVRSPGRRRSPARPARRAVRSRAAHVQTSPTRSARASGRPIWPRRNADHW